MAISHVVARLGVSLDLLVAPLTILAIPPILIKGLAQENGALCKNFLPLHPLGCGLQDEISGALGPFLRLWLLSSHWQALGSVASGGRGTRAFF